MRLLKRFDKTKQNIDIVAKSLVFLERKVYPRLFEICQTELEIKLFETADTKNKKLTS